MTPTPGTAEGPTGGFTGWVTTLMETLGAPGAGLAVALENVFPPLPSEVILPLAGFTAGQGEMSLVAALTWTTAGSVVGALVLYGAGAWLGRDRALALAARVPLVSRDDLDRTERWFARHGTKAVFFGRMVPLFRALVSIPAGVVRMPLPLFVALTAAGSAVWNTVFVLAGYALGENWHRVADGADTYAWAVGGATALVVAVLAAVRVRRRRRRRRRRGPRGG